ncbi:MAG: hypothetical protein MUC50_22805 [Myxococcota bacterium]|nr:hypothetical protein [Myxococcota bacterium]
MVRSPAVSQDAEFVIPAQRCLHVGRQLVIVGVGLVEERLEVVRNRNLSFKATSPMAPWPC